MPHNHSTVKVAFVTARALVFAGHEPSLAQRAAEEAIAEINKLGGTVIRDGEGPCRPVGSVDLQGIAISDKDLRHVAALNPRWWVNLRDTAVTDTGLEHLRGLTP